MVVQPKDMAYYIKDYLQATDKFDLGGKKVTIGEFIRGIFKDQQYITGLVLPRLPNVPELEDLVGKSNDTQRQDANDLYERTPRRDDYNDRDRRDRRDYSPPRDRRRRYDDRDDDRDRKRTRYDRSPSPRSRRRSSSPRRHSPRRERSPVQKKRSPSPRREKSPVKRNRTPSPPRSPPESRFSKAPVAQTSALLSDYHGKVDKQKLGGSSAALAEGILFVNNKLVEDNLQPSTPVIIAFSDEGKLSLD